MNNVHHGLKNLDNIVIKLYNMKKRFGILFRLQSFWIGLHYSKTCKRFCLNILPCITIWWIKKDGLPVDITKM